MYRLVNGDFSISTGEFCGGEWAQHQEDQQILSNRSNRSQAINIHDRNRASGLQLSRLDSPTVALDTTGRYHYAKGVVPSNDHPKIIN